MDGSGSATECCYPVLEKKKTLPQYFILEHPGQAPKDSIHFTPNNITINLSFANDDACLKKDKLRLSLV